MSTGEGELNKRGLTITQVQEFSDDHQKSHSPINENNEEHSHEIEEIKQENEQLRLKIQLLEEKCARYESQVATTLEMAMNPQVETLQSSLHSVTNQLKESESLNRELTIQNQDLKLKLQGAQITLQEKEEEIQKQRDIYSSQQIEDRENVNHLHMEVDRLRQQLSMRNNGAQPSEEMEQALDTVGMRQELDRERQKSRHLESERQMLMKQIQYEQSTRIEKKKHKLELEARLKTAELEAQKSQEERLNLEEQISDMKKTQNQLLSKIRETQEFLEVTTTFLQKNGLLATSFISDDPF